MFKKPENPMPEIQHAYLRSIRMVGILMSILDIIERSIPPDKFAHCEFTNVQHAFENVKDSSMRERP